MSEAATTATTTDPGEPSTALLQGRHKITLGDSLRHAQDAASFHEIRFNFQPSTINHAEPGSLTSHSGAGGEYTLSLPSKDTQRHIFKGHQSEGREIDCLLIYDNVKQSYVLERLDSVLRFDHQRSTGTAAAATAAASHEAASSAVLPPVPSQERLPTAAVSTPTTVPKHAQDKHHAIAEEGEPDDDDDEDDDGDLDDLAHLLESTLDESVAPRPPIPPQQQASTSHSRGRDDESSEEED